MSEFDSSDVGKARRLIIATLDDYGCTVAEFRATFGDISETTFQRYASGVRSRPRPGKILMHTDWRGRTPRAVPMTPGDAREIATVTLLRAEIPVAVIVEALRDQVSKSKVYRLRDRNWWAASSPAECRMRSRHQPSWPGWYQKRPVEKRREARWRSKRWVTRARGKVN